MKPSSIFHTKGMCDSILTILALLLLTSGSWATVIVAPGETINLSPEDCASASGYRLSGQSWDACPTGCETSCDLDEGKAGAYFELDHTVGYKFVTSTIFGNFTISDSAQTEAEVDVTVDYDISWRGLWTLSGLLTYYNESKAEITIYIYDITDGGRVVKKTDPPVHTMTPSGSSLLGPEVGANIDDGETSNSLSAKLNRGHTYRVALTIHMTGKGIDNAMISLDYYIGDFGLYWNEVHIRVSPDITEQLAQLEERITILEEEVAWLHSALEHHTHTYMTGRGVGHNNTEAQTSEAIIMEDENLADSLLDWLPDDQPDLGEPPSKSVLLTNYPNPFNPTTTILFSLPEPARVKIVVYNTLGQAVMTVLDEFRDTGEQTVELDASALATGVYFYRLTTPRYAETRKLLLLK